MMDDLINAVLDFADARKDLRKLEHRLDNEGCYEIGYYTYDERRRLSESRDALAAALDSYIDERVKKCLQTN
jgi:hypothetical protein